MENIRKNLKKIPLVVYLYNRYQKKIFIKKWRKKNAHNETSVNNIFPIELVSVGKRTYGPLNILSFYPESGEQLSIGNYVSIAENVRFILGGNHQISNYTTFPLYVKLLKQSGYDVNSNGPIIVEDDAWIGTDAIILSGITIGKGAVVGAGAVVTKDVPPYSIVGGNPAKIIKYRFSIEIIEILMQLDFNILNEFEIKNNIDIFYKNINSVQDAIELKSKIEKIIADRSNL